MNLFSIVRPAQHVHYSYLNYYLYFFFYFYCYSYSYPLRRFESRYFSVTTVTPFSPSP